MEKEKKVRLPHKHDLYEAAVQEPEVEIDFVSKTFRRLKGRAARLLREDFCGTALFSLKWAESHHECEAWGVDLHQPTLDWGLKHRIRHSKTDAQSRVHLRCADVRAPEPPLVDATVAFNFSYWCFKTRAELRQYFEAARSGLKKDGVLFLDAYGGTDVPMEDTTERKCKLPKEWGNVKERTFQYRWVHRSFNPLTNELKAQIDFEPADGRIMKRAFNYDWRYWTLVEIRELLEEAGFRRVRVYWEREDEDGDGTGTFYEAKNPDNEGIWWVYIAAEN